LRPRNPDDPPIRTPETREEYIEGLVTVFEMTPDEAEVLASEGYLGYLRWKHGVAGLA
jgi:hypothetical protein